MKDRVEEFADFQEQNFAYTFSIASWAGARSRAGVETVAVGALAEISGAVGRVSVRLVGFAQDPIQNPAAEVV